MNEGNRHPIVTDGKLADSPGVACARVAGDNPLAARFVSVAFSRPHFVPRLNPLYRRKSLRLSHPGIAFNFVSPLIFRFLLCPVIPYLVGG